MKKKKIITRRTAIIGGLGAVSGLLLTGCSKKLPPTYGNLLRMGDDLTYIAQRTLLHGHALAREYGKSDISSFPATGSTNPGDPAKPAYNKDYAKLNNESFSGWRLSV